MVGLEIRWFANQAWFVLYKSAEGSEQGSEDWVVKVTWRNDTDSENVPFLGFWNVQLSFAEVMGGIVENMRWRQVETRGDSKLRRVLIVTMNWENHKCSWYSCYICTQLLSGTSHNSELESKHGR